MNLVITKAKAIDLHAITSLEIDVFNQTFTADYVDTFLQNESLLVAKNNNSVVGVVGWFEQEDFAEIIMIGVKKEFRNQQIGSMLLKACISMLLSKRINKLFIEVRKSNEAAIALYRKTGFVFNRKREKYYQNPSEDAIEMRLEL